jgi:hypothetical protein
MGEKRMKRSRHIQARRLLAIAALFVAIAVLTLDSRSAVAGPPTVDANVGNINANVGGKVTVDVAGLQQVVKQLDADAAALAKTTQTRARDDILAILQQTSASVRAQIAQIEGASIQVVNSVGDRIDAQLQSVLRQVQTLESRASAMVREVEEAIAKHLDHQIEQIEQTALLAMQQLHRDIQEAAAQIAKFIDQELDRLYVRSGDTGDTVAGRLSLFNQRLTLVAAHALLGGIALFLLLRLARQGSEALQKGGGWRAFPIEACASGVALVTIAVLLFNTSALTGALALAPPEQHIDQCTLANADYLKFMEDNKNSTSASTTPDTSTAHRLGFEGVTVEEELQRCVYLSVSEDRVKAASVLMNDVRVVLNSLPKNTVVAIAPKGAQSPGPSK